MSARNCGSTSSRGRRAALVTTMVPRKCGLASKLRRLCGSAAVGSAISLGGIVAISLGAPIRDSLADATVRSTFDPDSHAESRAAWLRSRSTPSGFSGLLRYFCHFICSVWPDCCSIPAFASAAVRKDGSTSARTLDSRHRRRACHVIVAGGSADDSHGYAGSLSASPAVIVARRIAGRRHGICLFFWNEWNTSRSPTSSSPFS